MKRHQNLIELFDELFKYTKAVEQIVINNDSNHHPLNSVNNECRYALRHLIDYYKVIDDESVANKKKKLYFNKIELAVSNAFYDLLDSIALEFSAIIKQTTETFSFEVLIEVLGQDKYRRYNELNNSIKAELSNSRGSERLEKRNIYSGVFKNYLDEIIEAINYFSSDVILECFELSKRKLKEEKKIKIVNNVSVAVGVIGTLVAIIALAVS